VPKPTSKTTARAPRLRKDLARKQKPASVPYEEWLLERLKSPEEAAAYLEAALEEGDQAILMLALRQVAMARGGVAKLARRSKLAREATYRMLSDTGNPELRSLRALLRAAGLRLSVKPLAAPAG